MCMAIKECDDTQLVAMDRIWYGKPGPKKRTLYGKDNI